MATGRVTSVLGDEKEGVLGLGAEANGKVVVYGTVSGRVRLWSEDTGVAETVGSCGGSAWEVAIRPGGNDLAAACGDGSGRYWDLSGSTTGKIVRLGSGSEEGIDWFPGEKVLAWGTKDGSVGLWEPDSGTVTRSQQHAHEYLQGIAVSSDGTRIAASGHNGTVVFDREVRELTRIDGPHMRPAFHPDGRRLGITTMHGPVLVRDLETGSEVVLEGHSVSDEVNSVAFSPDGKLAVTASDDGTVRTWEVDTGRPFWRAPLMLSSNPILFSHRGWEDLRNPEPPGRPSQAAWEKAVESQGRLAAEASPGEHVCVITHDGNLEIWSKQADSRTARVPVGKAQQVLAIPGGCAVLSGGDVRSIDLLGSGKLVARDASAVDWDGSELHVLSGQRLQAFDDRGTARGEREVGAGAASLGHTRQGVLVGYGDGRIELRGPEPGAGVVVASHGLSSTTMRLIEGPGGTWITGHVNGDVAVWDAETGELLDSFPLHGRAIWLQIEGSTLYAASDLGDTLVADLGVLVRDECELLREVWKEVPVAWESGRAVRRPPPAGHRCLEAR